jgi:uncharacterized damage-inducible protein DinB
MASHDHKASLCSTLSNQRDHILEILEGLSDEDLRRPVLPSRWTCLGLVHHLALDVERFWFRDVFAGELMQTEDDVANAWHVPAGMTAEAVFALYRAEIERADAVIDASSLDQAPANWPVERWPNWRFDDLQRLMLHVITETAVHAGHLDAVRELIDGRQYLVLT